MVWREARLCGGETVSINAGISRKYVIPLVGAFVVIFMYTEWSIVRRAVLFAAFIACLYVVEIVLGQIKKRYGL